MDKEIQSETWLSDETSSPHISSQARGECEHIGDWPVYHDGANLSIVVALPMGLVMHVLKSAETVGFADIKKWIGELDWPRDDRRDFHSVCLVFVYLSQIGVRGRLTRFLIYRTVNVVQVQIAHEVSTGICDKFAQYETRLKLRADRPRRKRPKKRLRDLLLHLTTLFHRKASYEHTKDLREQRPTVGRFLPTTPNP